MAPHTMYADSSGSWRGNIVRMVCWEQFPYSPHVSTNAYHNSQVSGCLRRHTKVLTVQQQSNMYSLSRLHTVTGEFIPVHIFFISRHPGMAILIPGIPGQLKMRHGEGLHDLCSVSRRHPGAQCSAVSWACNQKNWCHCWQKKSNWKRAYSHVLLSS